MIMAAVLVSTALKNNIYQHQNRTSTLLSFIIFFLFLTRYKRTSEEKREREFPREIVNSKMKDGEMKLELNKELYQQTGIEWFN